MSAKRFFQIWDEVISEGSQKLKYMKTELIANIALKLLEEENKDRRTEEIGKKPKMITEAQKSLLKNKGIINTDTLTRQQASQMIDEIMRRKK